MLIGTYVKYSKDQQGIMLVDRSYDLIISLYNDPIRELSHN